ncbi:MAG: hypothetical protein JRN59_07935 [Nitrososphaerota archaeon]|nr:hypothetical protein [Nitrososphaerota archaeon]
MIKSHVVGRLLEEGHEVTAVDNLSEGHLENIAHLKDDKRFRFAKPARRTYIDICIQIRI